MCWRSTLDLVRAGEQKSAEGDGLALASPLRTRGHLLETTKCPSGPVTISPGPKLNTLVNARQAKSSIVLNRQNIEIENKKRELSFVKKEISYVWDHVVYFLFQ